MHWKRLAILGLVSGCGGGGGNDPTFDARREHDARVTAIDAAIDAEPFDAPVDAAIDAGIDAIPPDADLHCVLPPFNNGLSTLAGCDEPGEDDGARGFARFSNPVNVLRSATSNVVYVADFDSSLIRTVDATGTVTTLVNLAGFQRPFGLTESADGATLYVSTDDNDSGEHSPTTGTVWAVNTTTGAASVIVRDVGRPRGILTLGDGRLVLADYVHHTVRLLDPSNGNLTPLAGAANQFGWVDANGAAARFSGPYGLALLADGRIAVADLYNHRIRAVELDGDVTTLAGTGVPGADDGAVATATFNYPQDVSVDAAGNVYVADTENHVIRKIAAGQVSTLVGDGVAGYLDADDLRVAQLYGLEGIDVSPDGASIWIADGTRGEAVPYHRVRVGDLDGP